MQMSRHDKPVRCLLFYFAVHVVDWRLSIRNCFQLPACKNTLTAHLKGDPAECRKCPKTVVCCWFEGIVAKRSCGDRLRQHCLTSLLLSCCLLCVFTRMKRLPRWRRKLLPLISQKMPKSCGMKLRHVNMMRFEQYDLIFVFVCI